MVKMVCKKIYFMAKDMIEVNSDSEVEGVFEEIRKIEEEVLVAILNDSLVTEEESLVAILNDSLLTEDEILVEEADQAEVEIM